jgi:hypothetical protein
MHPEGPLQANNGSFYKGHEDKCQSKDERQPQGGMNPVWGLPRALHDKQQWHDNMAHNENGEIGRRIVCPLVVQGFTAMIATVRHLCEPGEKLSLAAGRTLATGPTPYGLLPGAACKRNWRKLFHGLRLIGRIASA